MTYRVSWLIGIQYLLSVIALAQNAEEKTSSHEVWDVPLYADNTTPQDRWFKTLLARDEPLHILDLGCGDGRFTEILAIKYPHAFVTGVDPSKEMIAHANKYHKKNNLIFAEGNAENLLFSENFHQIYSSSVLHRLNNPEQAVQGIYNALKMGGKFKGTFPIKGSQLYSEALAVVDSHEKWKKYFPEKQRKDYNASPQRWRERFEDAGFTVIVLESLAQNEPFLSRDKFRDFIRCTSLYRYLLPAERQLEFFEEVVDEYLKRVPMNEDGTITLQLTRLEIVAYKIEKPKL